MHHCDEVSTEGVKLIALQAMPMVAKSAAAAAAAAAESNSSSIRVSKQQQGRQQQPLHWLATVCSGGSSDGI